MSSGMSSVDFPASPGRSPATDHPQVKFSALRIIALAVLVGILAVVGALISTRMTGDYLQVPWGRGDSAFYYMLASTMIRHGWLTFNPDIGYPYSMDLSSFPMPEFRSWFLLKLVSGFVDDPIVALNLFFLAGFFLVGACSYLLFIRTVRVEWFAVILSLSAATLPWHFHRFQHVLLAEYSAVPIAVLLAQLMWSGWWRGSRARLGMALAAAAYVGLGGVYYTAFALLTLVPILTWRVFTARRLGLWWPDASVVLVVGGTFAASVAATRLASVLPSAGVAYVREPLESLVYAGDLASLVTPWPFWDGSGEGFAQFSPVVSAAVVLAIGLLVLLATPWGRSRVGGSERLMTELTPWFRLLVWYAIWWLPGPGWVFAATISPVIRSWGRLSVWIAFTVLVILGIALRTLMRHRRWAVPAVGAALGIMVAGQVSLDHRTLLTGNPAGFQATAMQYTTKVRDLIPEGCPILQLPIMENPEDWTRAEMGMHAYDHMWMPLYAPEYRWSFGVVTGTEPWLEARSRYFDESTLGQVLANAREDGFCAVHVDEAGMSSAEMAEVKRELGAPMVDVDRWRLYRLKDGT